MKCPRKIMIIKIRSFTCARVCTALSQFIEYGVKSGHMIAFLLSLFYLTQVDASVEEQESAIAVAIPEKLATTR